MDSKSLCLGTVMAGNERTGGCSECDDEGSQKGATVLAMGAREEELT